jgi:hypothetical protein
VSSIVVGAGGRTELYCCQIENREVETVLSVRSDSVLSVRSDSVLSELLDSEGALVKLPVDDGGEAAGRYGPSRARGFLVCNDWTFLA